MGVDRGQSRLWLQVRGGSAASAMVDGKEG